VKAERLEQYFVVFFTDILEKFRNTFELKMEITIVYLGVDQKLFDGICCEFRVEALLSLNRIPVNIQVEVIDQSLQVVPFNKGHLDIIYIILIAQLVVDNLPNYFGIFELPHHRVEEIDCDFQ
jgi:hypothetical protein